MHDKRCLFGGESSNTLLGFETTGPAMPRVLRGRGASAVKDPRLGVGSVFVVALLWWWGVVFDLWIVVASI